VAGRHVWKAVCRLEAELLEDLHQSSVALPRIDPRGARQTAIIRAPGRPCTGRVDENVGGSPRHSPGTDLWDRRLGITSSRRTVFDLLSGNEDIDQLELGDVFRGSLVGHGLVEGAVHQGHPAYLVIGEPVPAPSPMRLTEVDVSHVDVGDLGIVTVSLPSEIVEVDFEPRADDTFTRTLRM
jgi:hypothetical protein